MRAVFDAMSVIYEKEVMCRFFFGLCFCFFLLVFFLVLLLGCPIRCIVFYYVQVYRMKSTQVTFETKDSLCLLGM